MCADVLREISISVYHPLYHCWMHNDLQVALQSIVVVRMLTQSPAEEQEYIGVISAAALYVIEIMNALIALYN